MPKKPILTEESFIDMPFPLKGIDLSKGYGMQQPGTTVIGQNVRAYEPTSARARGGQRNGIQKYIQGQINGSASVQEINSIILTAGNIPGSTGATVNQLFGWANNTNFGPYPNSIGTSNPITGPTSVPWTFTAGPGASVVAFYTNAVGGGSSPHWPSYSASLGIADNTPVVSIFAVTGTTYQLYVNGTPTAVPANLPTLAGNSLIPSTIGHAPSIYGNGQNSCFVVAGIFATSGSFGIYGYSPAGGLVWSQTSKAAPGAGTYRVVIANDNTRVTIAGSTELVQVALPDGSVPAQSASGYVFATYASIYGSASGYLISGLQTGGTGLYDGVMVAQTSQTTHVAICLVQTPATATSAPANIGLALISTANANYGTINTYLGIPYVGTIANCRPCVTADTTTGAFYVLNPAYGTDSSGNLLGAVLKVTQSATLSWTTQSALLAGATSISFAKGQGVLQVAGPQHSVALDLSGNLLGGGPPVGLPVVCDAVPGQLTGLPTQVAGNKIMYQPANVLVGVAGGTVAVAYAGQWHAVTSGNQLDSTAPVIRSAVNNGYLYFADGSHWFRYNPATNTLENWAATSGALPVDNSGNAPRLIATWRGRTCLSGLQYDPRNVFMSAVSDPTNWNYNPLAVTPTQAIVFNASPFGLVGDVVTCLAPYNDDILMIGGDHSLWVMNGDPMAGGRLDLVSDGIGVAFGNPWCKDPYGNLFFVSNLMGLYQMVPNQGPPTRVSQQIEQILAGFNVNTMVFRMIWDDAIQGLHVYCTDYTTPKVATHLFWEQRTGAWWTDVFGNNNHNPKCVHVYNGNSASDRVALLGSWDGYLRCFQMGAPNDDGTAITSKVLIGPLLTKDQDDIMCKDLQGIMGANSGTVTYSVLTGTTAETTLNNAPVVTGKWIAGRNYNTFVRSSGHGVWVQLSATTPWAMETIRARMAGLGKVRRRGY
jgi:hypothetical protein